MSLSIEKKGQILRVEGRISPAWPGSIAGILLFLFWWLATSETVTGIRRPDGRVDATLQSTRVGCASATQSISDLREATLETDRGQRMPRSPEDGPITLGEQRDPDTFRVILVDGTGGKHPVTSYRSSGEGHHRRFAEEINRQLANPRTARWTAGQPIAPATFLFLALAGLVGGAAFFTHGSITLDPAADRMELGQPGFGGHRRLALSEVREVRTVISPISDDRTPNLQPAIVHADGRVEILRHWSFVSDDEVLTMVNALERHRAAAELDRARRTSAAAEAPPAPTAKICAACGRDCSDAERVRDPLGRYYHATCLPPGR